ncbi:hypothetical protein FGL86_07130 [Pistricoccus aurantiacus]|uniref:Uncharacterized protein n=1 Tax=Pistricoccus aurantiacus TaxID=1883414 RepID=A0A5B8SP58_9GAMM|nr:hypothetical protein [Pistricoccus aurantiacus]QEA38869.1 hypothetical protein FGL86_07130 [Pistricoccus aurantiacus]
MLPITHYPQSRIHPPLKESFYQAALFASLIILGGLRSGLFTPTEMAVGYSLLLDAISIYHR